MNDERQEYERLIAPIEDRMIRAVWCITRDPHDAEDALQEALLTVWKRWHRVCRHPNPHALILHMCVNAGYDLLRRRAREQKRQGPIGAAENIPDLSPSAAQTISRGEQDAEVLRAIGLLSKNQGRAMLMLAVEEMSYSDIAAALDCREVTARGHVARARSKLRELLSHLIPAIHKEEGSHA